MKYDVIIAGGGFAGAYCARALGKALGAEGVERVALIAERNVFTFQPMLAEVVGSSLSPIDVVQPLRQFCRSVDVLQGAIHQVDWTKRQVTVNGGRFSRDHVVGFKHLVLALGSITDLSRVPGMTDYGWPLKTAADALRLRAAVINRLEEANLVEDVEVRNRLLSFVVVGGGFTGVEVAGQLLDFLDEVKRFYVNIRDCPLRVVLVHSQAHLLAEIGPKLGDYAEGVLRKRGMDVRLNSRVAEVTSSKVIFQDGDFIEAHTVVSTIGNATHPIVSEIARQVGVTLVTGRLPVDATMRVKPELDLWAIGDCALVPWHDKKELKTAPPTAQFAQREGTQLGGNLARVLNHGLPRPFSYTYMGQLATVGERAAVAEIFGFRFSGFLAWWTWRTLYLAKLPGIARRLRVMIDWTFDLIFPRDLAVLIPPPDEDLRPIHLEPGEVLVSPGDRVRAFYLVRKGSLSFTRDAAAKEILPEGTIVDQSYALPTGVWSGAISAETRADVMVFRGRMLSLLQKEVHLEQGARPIVVQPDTAYVTPAGG